MKYSQKFLFCFFFIGLIGLPFQLMAETDENLLNPLAIKKINQHSNKASYKFVVTGDNRDGDQILLKVFKDAERFQPRFAIHTGDFIPSGTQQQYLTFIDHLKKAIFPVIPAIGNHDAYKGGRKWYNQYFGKSYFAFDHGSDRFIFLDNAEGVITAGQMEWFEKQLKLKRRYKFVAMHKPAYNTVWFHAFSGESAEKMLQLVDKYKPNYVFYGHIHIYDKMVRNGVTYIVSGGAGAPLYRMPVYLSPEGGAFHHYMLMEVTDQGIKENVVRLK